MFRFRPAFAIRTTIAATAALLFLTATDAPAQDFSRFDPTTPNNVYGKTIRIPGTGRTEEGSKLGVVDEPRLTEDGYFLDGSFNRGQLGALLRDARTGKAFWEYTDRNGKRHATLAAPKWQAVLDDKERRQAEIDRNRVAQQQQFELAQRQQQAARQQQFEMAQRQEAARQQAARQQQYIQWQLQQLNNAVNQPRPQRK